MAFLASGVPGVAVILFIVGAAFWVLSTLYGWAREPWTWDRNFGEGLMVLAVGLRIIFGIA